MHIALIVGTLSILLGGCAGAASTDDAGFAEGDTGTSGGDGGTSDTGVVDAGGTADAGGGTDAGPAAALGAQVSSDNIAADLAVIAVARPPGSSDWQAVQDLCAARFAAFGYTVERQEYGTGVNVIGTKKGGGGADGSVIVSAHYDSIENCAGADDNASGWRGCWRPRACSRGVVFPRPRGRLLGRGGARPHRLQGVRGARQGRG